MAVNINNRLIVLAREYRGKTQSQLAKEINGLTQGNLSRIEKGLLGITDEILEKISSNLDFPKSFFSSNDHVKTPITDFYYRKRVTIPKKTLSKLEAKFDIYRITIDKLLEAVEVPEFILPQFNLNLGGNPEDSARKIRQFLSVEKGPINNLVKLLEKNGIIIISFNADTEKFDGITVFTDAGQPIIFINNNMPNDRKRFTISHELGHLVLHIPFSPLSNDRDVEDEADRFASEFNLPYLEARNELTNMRFSDLVNLKRYWKTSMAFILRRAKDTKAITPKRYKNFMIELSRRGYRKKEPIHVELDRPKLFKQMVDVHLKYLNYTKQELADMLSISLNDFNKLLGQENKIVKLKIVQN